MKARITLRCGYVLLVAFLFTAWFGSATTFSESLQTELRELHQEDTPKDAVDSLKVGEKLIFLRVIKKAQNLVHPEIKD